MGPFPSFFGVTNLLDLDDILVCSSSLMPLPGVFEDLGVLFTAMIRSGRRAKYQRQEYQ
jgi:hypothetical protein